MSKFSDIVVFIFSSRSKSVKSISFVTMSLILSSPSSSLQESTTVNEMGGRWERLSKNSSIVRQGAGEGATESCPSFFSVSGASLVSDSSPLSSTGSLLENEVGGC